MRTAAGILAALALMGSPTAALAQDNPLGPLPTPAPSQPQTVVVAPSTDGGDGLKGWQQGLILGAGLVLLAGIAWAIVSDARRRAPVKDNEMAHPGLDAAPKRNRSQKQRERDRAKAKLARQRRKRNRGR
jgi:hypothetical protein